MALAMLRSSLRAAGLAAGVRAAGVCRPPSIFLAPAVMFSTSRITHAAAKSNRAPVAPEEIKPYEEAKPSKEVQQFEEDADEAEVDENYDPMDGLSAAVRRRVLALKELQKQYDESSRGYQRELAELQAKYQAKYAPLFDERKAIILGEKDVPKFDIPDDEEGDEKRIPEFWQTAFINHEKLGQYITERDSEVLQHLVDVRCEVLTGEERGFTLIFHFEDNKFFSDKTLSKTYTVEPEDEVVPKKFVGCKINWKDPSLDVTVEQRKKRVKSKDGKGKPAFTTETVPCESFFNLFDPAPIPSNPEELGDEELEALQDELTVDYDIGFAIKENIIPRAVEWYTGEIAPLGDEYEDNYEDEFGESDEQDMAPEPEPSYQRRDGSGRVRR